MKNLQIYFLRYISLIFMVKILIFLILQIFLLSLKITYIVTICFIVFEFLSIIIPFLLTIAYLTLLERKFMGIAQRRRGPNIVGVFGLLQPLADGLKLFCKEAIIPILSNRILFLLAPIITFTLSLLPWTVISFNGISVLFDLELSALFLLALSSLNIYGIIMSGWSSNSKYAFLGSLRSASQMISYELSMGICLLCVFLYSQTFNLQNIIMSQIDCSFIAPLLPIFFIFMICMIAETNRAPFDLPEAEAELVSGYNVEYSGISFALFFLAEYGNMITMSFLSSLFFLGGGNIFSNGEFCYIILSLKSLFFLFLFVICRIALPRFRYDNLMYLGWKILLPLSFGLFFFFAALYYTFTSSLYDNLDILIDHLDKNSPDVKAYTKSQDSEVHKKDHSQSASNMPESKQKIARARDVIYVHRAVRLVSENVVLLMNNYEWVRFAPSPRDRVEELVKIIIKHVNSEHPYYVPLPTLSTTTAENLWNCITQLMREFLGEDYETSNFRKHNLHIYKFANRDYIFFLVFFAILAYHFFKITGNI